MRDKSIKGSFIGTGVVFVVLYFVGSVVHAEIVLDGSLGSTDSLAGPEYKINQDLGRTTGNNVFHSFETFNVNTGESATFFSSPAVENIISRVTGDQASWIDGPLRGRLSGTDSLSSANLYFLNPNGILFGPKASLNIGGSFHASTAEQLEFDNGEVFSTRADAGAPMLSAATPEAFGFLGDATIELHGSILESSHDIALYGGTIALKGAIIHTTTVGTEAGGDITLTADQEISLSGNDVNSLGFSLLAVSAEEGAGGTLHVEAPIIKLHGAAMFTVVAGSGSVGELSVTATERLTLSGVDRNGIGSTLQAGTLAGGEAGALRVEAPVIELQDGAWMSTSTAGAGQGGELIVAASERLTLSGADNNGRSSSLQVVATAEGNAGTLNVDAPVIKLQDGAFMVTRTEGLGQGGDVVVTASEHLALSGTNKNGTSSSLQSNTLEDGKAGGLHVNATVIELQDGAFMVTRTEGLGQGGDVIVTASERLTFIGSRKDGDGSSLQSAAIADGDAGTLYVDAPVIELYDGARMTANTRGSGRGGALVVTASELLTLSGADNNGRSSTLQAATFSDGEAGGVSVEAPVIWLHDGAFIVTSTEGTGQGGDLVVTASESITLSGADNNGRSSTLQAATFASGKAGGLRAEARVIELQDGAWMATNTEGEGQGGELVVTATESLTLSGTDNRYGRGSSLQAGTLAGGEAGALRVEAPVIELQDGAFMRTNTKGRGKGGALVVTASDRLALSGVDINGSASVLETTTFAEGNAGALLANAPVIELQNGAWMSSSTQGGTGLGGGLTVTASEHLTLSGTDGNGVGSRLQASTFGEGDGGRIYVQAPEIFAAHGAVIASNALGLGNAAPITIIANEILHLSANSAITTEALTSAGGDISIQVGHLLHLQDSKITTNVASGQGSGGNITIGAAPFNATIAQEEPVVLKPELVVLNRSQITANADAGLGGEIRIAADHVITSADSVITASAGPAGIDGSISIDAPDTDIDGTLAGLPASFIDTAQFLRNSCAKRARGQASSFVVNSVGGINTDPDQFLPAYAVDAASVNPRISLHRQVEPLSLAVPLPAYPGGNLLAKLSTSATQSTIPDRPCVIP